MSKGGQGDVAFDQDLKGVWAKPSSGCLEKSISDSRNGRCIGPGVGAAPVSRTSQKANVAGVKSAWREL